MILHKNNYRNTTLRTHLTFMLSPSAHATVHHKYDRLWCEMREACGLLTSGKGTGARVVYLSMMHLVPVVIRHGTCRLQHKRSLPIWKSAATAFDRGFRFDGSTSPRGVWGYTERLLVLWLVILWRSPVVCSLCSAILVIIENGILNYL